LTGPSPQPPPPRRVFAALNPAAGSAKATDVRQALARHFPEGQAACEIHEAGAGEPIDALVHAALARGCDLVVAAGGDGTVSMVAGALAGDAADVPLGIIPLGTANVLARDLGIPLDPEEACRLLASPPEGHATTRIDAMRVGPGCYFTQVGVGIDALMIRDTRREDKRRFGRIAYLWTASTHLLGFQPGRFVVEADGRRQRARASQVVVANSGILGQPPFRWGPDIRPNDGRLDVCIIRARTLLDYARLGWYVLTAQHHRSPNVRYLAVRHAVAISSRRPLPVQGDGEILGETPVTVEVVPGAVAVIVPAAGYTWE
jgi:diacylglycerol kinase family enzyme